MEILGVMARGMSEVDTATYSGAILAFEIGGGWPKALELYSAILLDRFAGDAIVCNAVLYGYTAIPSSWLLCEWVRSTTLEFGRERAEIGRDCFIYLQCWRRTAKLHKTRCHGYLLARLRLHASAAK